MSRWIWIIAGGLLQEPCVRIAHELDYFVLVTDKNSECACANIADRFEQIDTKDVSANLNFAENIDMKIDAAFTAGAEVPYTVACIARQLGLPGLDPKVVLNISNKAKMRMKLANKSYSVRCAMESDYDSLKSAAQLLFGEATPFIVKATDGSGSRGLTKCLKLEEFTQEVFQRAQAVSGDRQVLIEEWLQPNPDEKFVEQSVETIWKDGKGAFLNYVDRPFLKSDQWAIEWGHLNPAQHSIAIQMEIENILMDAGRTLEMDTGILKADIMLTDKGARILELTPRLSGGFDSAYTSPLAHGVDYIKAAMLLALGDDIHLEYLLPRQYRHAVAMSAFPKPGRVTRIMNDAPKNVLVFPRVQVGDVIPEYMTCVDRPLFVVASGDSREIAVARASNALNHIVIETE